MAKRTYFIDQNALAKLDVLGDKVLELINNYRQRVMSGAATSTDPQEFLHSIRKYINRQRDQRLYVGTVRAIDHKLNEPRDFRVYLSASTGAGGYFDDYMDIDFLEYIKMLADERGIEAAARKHRLRKSVVQYAQETPVKDLRPLRGRGDIVLNVEEVLRNQPRPRIMDLLTHELTHGVQMLTPSSADYDSVAAKIHRGENLTREDRHIYYKERAEFEAQLNGMLGRMRAKYRALNDVDQALDELQKQQHPEDITSQDIQKYIKESKQRFRDSYEANLMALKQQTAQEFDANVDAIERQFIELANSIKHSGEEIDMLDQQLDDVTAQAKQSRLGCLRGNQDACNRLKELKPIYDKLFNERQSLYETNAKLHADHQALRAKYLVFSSESRDFIASISNSKVLWKEFKQAIRNFIDSLE